MFETDDIDRDYYNLCRSYQTSTLYLQGVKSGKAFKRAGKALNEAQQVYVESVMPYDWRHGFKDGYRYTR